MQTSWPLLVLPGLLAGLGIAWVLSRRDSPAAPLSFIDVCGTMEACWAVLNTTSAVGNLARASDGRYWVFNNESPLHGDYSDGVAMEMVRAPQNHTMGAAHECFIDRCSMPLHECGLSFACRGAWTDMLDGLSSVVDLALLKPEQIFNEHARNLASCFFSRCLCIADLAAGDQNNAGDTSAPASSTAHMARFPNAIDEEDVDAILKLAAAIGKDASFVEERNFGALPRGQSSPLGGQRVTYLQSRFTTDPLTARVYARLRELVVQADAQSGWQRVHTPTMVPRTIELLNYTSSAQNADASFALGWHIDEQSALTALLMLSDPANFSGGELYHIARGEVRAAHARQHELLVYRSHSPHAVGALTAGTRLTVALEFWHVRVPGEGAEHPGYPTRRIPLLPRPGAFAPEIATLGRCPR